jgi:hypothetical protein
MMMMMMMMMTAAAAAKTTITLTINMSHFTVINQSFCKYVK